MVDERKASAHVLTSVDGITFEQFAHIAQIVVAVVLAVLLIVILCKGRTRDDLPGRMRVAIEPISGISSSSSSKSSSSAFSSICSSFFSMSGIVLTSSSTPFTSYFADDLTVPTSRQTSSVSRRFDGLRLTFHVAFVIGCFIAGVVDLIT